MAGEGWRFEDGVGWRQVLGQIVTLASLARVTGLPVVDFEYWAALNGSPFELADGGYPADAAQTAMVSVASQEQIREKGGKFNFFR